MRIYLGDYQHVIRVITAYAWMKDALQDGDQCLIDSFQTIYLNQSTKPDLRNELANLGDKFPKLKP